MSKEWIKWDGGECPVPMNTKVGLKTRCLGEFINLGHVLSWEHHDDMGDIIAYRIMTPEYAENCEITDVSGKPSKQKCSQCENEIDKCECKSKKFDTGKSQLAYFDQYFPNAINGVQAVSKFGAEKYGWNTWQGVDAAIMRYKHALRRHQLALACGELCDHESGLRHEYHIAWNALAVAELETLSAIKA